MFRFFSCLGLALTLKPVSYCNKQHCMGRKSKQECLLIVAVGNMPTHTQSFYSFCYLNTCNLSRKQRARKQNHIKMVFSLCNSLWSPDPQRPLNSHEMIECLSLMCNVSLHNSSPFFVSSTIMHRVAPSKPTALTLALLSLTPPIQSISQSIVGTYKLHLGAPHSFLSLQPLLGPSLSFPVQTVARGPTLLFSKPFSTQQRSNHFKCLF